VQQAVAGQIDQLQFFGAGRTTNCRSTLLLSGSAIEAFEFTAVALDRRLVSSDRDSVGRSNATLVGQSWLTGCPFWRNVSRTTALS